MWSHSVFRDTGIPLLIVAPSGRISSANPAAQELVGRRSLTGTDLGDLMASPDRTQLDAFLSTVASLPAGGSQSFGPVGVTWRGRPHQIQLVGSRVRDPHGFDALVVGLTDAPDARSGAPGEVDPLTGAGTRARGMRDLAGEVAPDATGCVALIDLDGFAAINMTYGFAEGDRILAEVGARLMRIAPPAAGVSRFDGDSFLLVSPRTPTTSAQELGREVLAAMARPLRIAGTQVVTASIGVAGLAGSSLDEVLIHAQEALAVAKQQGGNQVVIHGPAMATFGRRDSDKSATPKEVEDRIRIIEAERDEARREARTDALTQLANRLAYDEELPRLQARARRTQSSVAVLFLDLDEFGSINRSLGQHRGDTALVAVAAVLADTCRSEDRLFRHGGEEFVVLLPDTDLAGAVAAAERLRSAVEAAAIPHWGRADLPILTVSVGAAADLLSERSLTHVVIDANYEMQLAKQRGRNQVSPPWPYTPHPSRNTHPDDVA